MSWVDDFYSRIWDNELQERLILLVQCMTKDPSTGKLISHGYLVQDLVNDEGKLNFGQFERGLIEPPISFRDLDEAPLPNSPNTVCFSIISPEEATLGESA